MLNKKKLDLKGYKEKIISLEDPFNKDRLKDVIEREFNREKHVIRDSIHRNFIIKDKLKDKLEQFLKTDEIT